jgi:hypothetical protein
MSSTSVPSGRVSFADLSAALASSSLFLNVTKRAMMQDTEMPGGVAPTATISVFSSKVGEI